MLFAPTQDLNVEEMNMNKTSLTAIAAGLIVYELGAEQAYFDQTFPMNKIQKVR